MSFHHLVNTTQFSYTARDFAKNGNRYTKAPYGSRDYYQFWEEEDRRCRFGYRVGDLWIPGRMYFWLNHFPINRVPEHVRLRVREQYKRKGQLIDFGAVEKEIGFPGFHEVHYEWWNFKHIAWYGGEFLGVKSSGNKHMACLKTRGAGWSYLEACDAVYNYNFIHGSKSYFFAGTEAYLIGDAVMDKVQSGLDHINTHSPYWKQNRQVKKTVMHQRASFLDAAGVEKGSFSEIIGQIVDKPSKAHPYSANIITPEGPKKWSEIQEGSKIFGSDGKVITVKATVELGEQDIYTIKFTDGRTVQCTIDHLWNIHGWHTRQKNKELYTYLREETIDTRELIRRLSQSYSKTNPLRVKLNGCTDYPESQVPVDAYTLGVLIGDGSLKRATRNITPLTMARKDVDAIKQYIPYKVTHCKWGTGIRNNVHVPNGKELFTRLNLADKTAGNKFIPDCYKYNSKEVRLGVINGLLDTDGSVTKDFGIIEYSTKSEQLAKDFIWVVHSLGYGGTVKSRKIKGQIYYRCYIYAPGNDTELFKLKRKQQYISKRKDNAKAVNITQYLKIESIVYSHREQAKCIQVDAKDSLYLIEDHIATHNTRGKRGRKISFEEGGSFPHLEAALEVAMGSLRESSVYVGQCSVFGTGGEQGPGIQGLENVFNNPEAWDMLQFPNVWEDGMQFSQVGYFVPCWRANSWFMDEDGNVEMEEAIKADDIERNKKKKTGNPKDLDRRKAEYPRTPSEALQRLTGNGFNQAELGMQIRRLQNDDSIKGLLRYGELINTPEGELLFVPQPKHIARPIEDFPHSQSEDTDLSGCLTVLQRPHVLDNGKVPKAMYMITFDAYAKEAAEDQTSLWSFKVWKLENKYDNSYVNIPVAWYSGRPLRYEDNHDLMFRVAQWYDCDIQGEVAGGGQSVITYAKQKRLLHRLRRSPESASSKENQGKSLQNEYLMDMPTERKRLGITYLEDWHRNPRAADEKGKIIMNLHHVYDIAFCREMMKHDPTKGNYDRISDAIIFMFEMKDHYINMVKQRLDKVNEFYNRELFGEEEQQYGEVVGLW